jgi:hypothetical protein
MNDRLAQQLLLTGPVPIVKTDEVTLYRILGRVIRARPQDYAVRQALRNLPPPTFEQAYTQTQNALKARPVDGVNTISSQNGRIVGKR